MGGRAARTLAGVACAVGLLIASATATPTIAFPFNSQVPTVARVNQPYSFQISDSTFSPASSNYVYSLTSQPAWLTIDSTTRTLAGTPGAGDVGSHAFTLTAADSTGAATMQCTLVVSSDPAPQLTGDVSKQLAETANLSSSQPPVVTLLPSTPFKFDFETASFIDIIQRKLYFYATLADHTPLPSWMKFDSEQLTFSGTAPDLSAFPQSWDISLIASDVAGFAGTSESFTIAIGTQQLVFVPEEQELNVTAGKPVNITVLRNELFRNNANISPSELRSAQASNLPSGLIFDASTLEIEGIAPAGFSGQNVTVIVTDSQGNNATAILNLLSGNSSLFEGQIGTLSATSGQQFRYHLDDSLFSQSNVDVSVSIPATASWLSYDAETRNLEGTVPSMTSAQTISATLTARASAGDEGQTQTFTIDVKSSPSTATSSSVLSPRTSAVSNPKSTPATAAAGSGSKRRLGGGVIAAIVILSILGAALLLAALIFCCRRRRTEQSYVEKSSPASKRTISRPLAPPDGNIAVTTEFQHDVEKYAGSRAVSPTDSVHPVHPGPPPPPKVSEPPPQIMMDFPLASHSATNATEKRKSGWRKRFSRISQASSLGVGEDAIRADQNIPEWEQQSMALHTPHDSFSLPAEIARKSRQLSDSSHQSPTKRALKRLQPKRDSKGSIQRSSVGSNAVGGLARHSSRRTGGKHRRGRSSFGGLSTTREASIATRSVGSSILSTGAFPRPPSSNPTGSLSMPTLSAFSTTNASELDPKRKSIRMVERSGSIIDNRPLDKKRESFIRNRASTHMQSPLFSHGSRASSSQTKVTGGRSVNASLAGSVRRSRRMKSGLTGYSESSSLEPQGHHRDSPHRQSKNASRDLTRASRELSQAIIETAAAKEKEKEEEKKKTKRFSQKLREQFSTGFPRAITKSTLYATDDEGGPASKRASRITLRSRSNSSNWDDISSDADLENSEAFAWRHEIHKPIKDRGWAFTGEASPTPPPTAPPTNTRDGTPDASPGATAISAVSGGSAAERLKAKIRQQSSSPLAQSATGSVRRNRLSEPSRLVSADSMHKGRPRIGGTRERRPVSVEDVKRLSSMKAETDAATVAGSERDWMTDDGGSGSEGGGSVRGAGIIEPHGSGSGRKYGGTGRSDLSGPAFL